MSALILCVLLAPPADPDRQTLTAAGVDPATAADYLRRRTLSPADAKRLQTVIAGLGAEAFADREAASKAALAFGPAAVGPLRLAVQQHPDPEVQHRASEALRELGKVPHARVAAAAVRVVTADAKPDAAGALLTFLPTADDRTVAAAVRAGLVKLAADPAVLAALTDSLVDRRAAAAVALVEGGAAKRPEVSAKVLAAALAEAEPDARFQMLFALATTARENQVVAPLLDLLPKLSRGRQWQVEDFLTQIAGATAPKQPFGRYTASDPALPAWRTWWKSNPVDLAAAKYTPRTTGGLLVVAGSAAADAILVSELGPDMQEQWRLPPRAQLADIRPLPDGRLHVGERLHGIGYRVSVVEPPTGAVVRTRTFKEQPPNQLDVRYSHASPLPTGGVLLVSQGEVVEYGPDGDKPVFRYQRTQKMDVKGACRLGDGRTLVLVGEGPNHGLLLDPSGAVIPDRTVPVNEPNYTPPTAAVGADRVLVGEAGRLAEYDATAGKLVWQRATGDRGGAFRMTHAVQRLPNGNTLYVEGGAAGRAVEVTPAGDEVWTYTPPGTGVSLFRAYSR